jgi:hypothetical protein
MQSGEASDFCGYVRDRNVRSDEAQCGRELPVGIVVAHAARVPCGPRSTSMWSMSSRSKFAPSSTG